jgi:general secretion pathway protein G
MRPSHGFTLIELLLVIIIISVFAAMVGLSVGGTSERQRLQARERLYDELSLIRLESVDQGLLLAVKLIPETTEQAAGYQVVTLDQTAIEKQNRWPIVANIKPQTLPERMRIVIQPLQSTLMASRNDALQDSDAPKLMWFGNGEATPVRIQLMQNEQPIGEPIYVTQLGQVSDDEHGRDQPEPNP